MYRERPREQETTGPLGSWEKVWARVRGWVSEYASVVGWLAGGTVAAAMIVLCGIGIAKAPSQREIRVTRCVEACAFLRAPKARYIRGHGCFCEGKNGKRWQIQKEE